MIQPSRSERIFQAFNFLFLGLFTLALLLPVLYVLRRSLDVGAFGETSLSLIPREPSLFYYKAVLQDRGVYQPFLNSLILTVVGTLLSIALESMAAYSLSKRDLPGNRLFIYMMVVTMMFSGGLVPSYLLIKGLGLIDKFPWVLILPSCIGAWNIFLIRNYYWSIPASLNESARIDGAQEFTIFSRIVLPLSIPVIAAIALFTGVGYWNTFFSAIIYINTPSKFTFAVKLREILALQMEMQNQFERLAVGQELLLQNLNMEGLYSAMIVISMLPIILVYPYLQKHFAKGIMVGSIKG